MSTRSGPIQRWESGTQRESLGSSTMPGPVDEAEDDEDDGGGVYPADGVAGDRAEDKAADDYDEHANKGLARFEDSHLCHPRGGESRQLHVRRVCRRIAGAFTGTARRLPGGHRGGHHTQSAASATRSTPVPMPFRA